MLAYALARGGGEVHDALHAEVATTTATFSPDAESRGAEQVEQAGRVGVPALELVMTREQGRRREPQGTEALARGGVVEQVQITMRDGRIGGAVVGLFGVLEATPP